MVRSSTHYARLSAMQSLVSTMQSLNILWSRTLLVQGDLIRAKFWGDAAEKWHGALEKGKVRHGEVLLVFTPRELRFSINAYSCCTAKRVDDRVATPRAAGVHCCSDLQVYCFSRGRVNVANKRFSTLSNNYELSFSAEADIKPAEDDGSIHAKRRQGLELRFHFNIGRHMNCMRTLNSPISCDTTRYEPSRISRLATEGGLRRI